MQSYKLRPHHGLCTAFFEGKGYSNDFTANMHEIIAMLESLDPTVMLIVGTDIICEKCPNNSDGICTSPKPAVYDERVLKMIGMNENDVLHWSVFRDAVHRHIIAGSRLIEVCGDCSWYEICSKKPS